MKMLCNNNAEWKSKWIIDFRWCIHACRQIIAWLILFNWLISNFSALINVSFEFELFSPPQCWSAQCTSIHYVIAFYISVFSLARSFLFCPAYSTMWIILFKSNWISRKHWTKMYSREIEREREKKEIYV